MKRKNPTPVIFLFAGLSSLLWFLIRVIPKPSRATYPCMRAAAPAAGSFVCWLLSIAVSGSLVGRIRRNLSRARYTAALLTVAGGCIAIIMINGNGIPGRVSAERVATTPIGEAKGVNPGRVVWVHDAAATDWAGPGENNGYWWEENHTDQVVVDRMVQTAVCRLAGVDDIGGAWATLLRYFNRTHGKGDAGYAAGEKIMIKINFVGCVNRSGGWCGVNPDTYNLDSQKNYMNTSPQVIVALLRQLTATVGAAQEDISIGDPTAFFPNQYYDYCAKDFPSVNYIDNQGKFGRTKAQHSSIPVYWSCRPAADSQDYVPLSYAEAAYLINVANLKSHALSGVTACAKNHFGSLIRLPDAAGYYDLHGSLPFSSSKNGQYRVLVDLMGHAHLGGKTVLYMIEGLYGGVHIMNGLPAKWSSTPFGGDWTSSIFASQDPVAIECVMYDILSNEKTTRRDLEIAAVDDYLIEASLADDPPSGTFYDPDHESATARLSGLGVCEHWNSPEEMLYSRNLGTGSGIELIRTGGSTSVTVKPVSKHATRISVGIRTSSGPTVFYMSHPISGSNGSAATLFDLTGRKVRSIQVDQQGALYPDNGDINHAHGAYCIFEEE
ncbi:MAG: DUF362 domain-containing protein [Chitinispirillaceae bacterium]|nr:DUF362 domain-containing protein [Chitinispirillaceae bacterium]